MKKEEVRELTRQFVAALEEEKEIRAKLLDLSMQGPEDEVRRNLAKHDAMIEEIGQLREQRMLPVLEQLGAFIAEQTGNARTPQQRLRDAVAEGKKRVQEKRLHPGMPGIKPKGAKKTSPKTTQKAAKAGTKTRKKSAKKKSAQ